MKPTVWKPTAVVLLVDDAQQKDDQNLASLAANHGVTASVQHITSSQVSPWLRRVQADSSIGLVAVVTNSPIQAEWMTIAQNPQNSTRYEFIGSSPGPVASNVIKQVVPDENAVGYALGWLSGQYASVMGNVPIGWITDGGSSAKQTSIEAALSGAYAANTLIQFTPVSLLQTPTIPQVLVATRVLSGAEWQVVKSHGCRVISLCKQGDVSSVLGQPIGTSWTVLDSDFQAFATSKWKPGLIQSKQPPFIWFNTMLVPLNVQTTLQTVGRSLQFGLAPLQQWMAVPPTLKQVWAPIVSSGSA